mmetsp:Transcript_29045/g.92716  ORF Transcript_29045/g.92716 Transcript_29045/m.92716 type:complete len:249 (+) Transcript_29045:584-1330(+)
MSERTLSNSISRSCTVTAGSSSRLWGPVARPKRGGGMSPRPPPTGNWSGAGARPGCRGARRAGMSGISVCVLLGVPPPLSGDRLSPPLCRLSLPRDPALGDSLATLGDPFGDSGGRVGLMNDSVRLPAPMEGRRPRNDPVVVGTLAPPRAVAAPPAAPRFESRRCGPRSVPPPLACMSGSLPLRTARSCRRIISRNVDPPRTPSMRSSLSITSLLRSPNPLPWGEDGTTCVCPSSSQPSPSPLGPWPP